MDGQELTDLERKALESFPDNWKSKFDVPAPQQFTDIEELEQYALDTFPEKKEKEPPFWGKYVDILKDFGAKAWGGAKAISEEAREQLPEFVKKEAPETSEVGAGRSSLKAILFMSPGTPQK